MNRIIKKGLNEKINLDLGMINLYAMNDLSSLILESEKFYLDQIKEIVEDITTPNSTIKLLLISGPSSAGKTTTSSILRLELLMKQIPSLVISLDNFYIDRKITPKFPDGSYDFENIRTLDLKFLNRFITKLLKTRRAKMPIFNFITGCREKTLTDVIIDEKTILIIEGLHALNPELIKNHESEIYKIYLDLNSNFSQNENVILPSTDVRLIRRITRDFYTRGYNVLETMNMWTNVCNGEDKWVKPFSETAHYVINTVHKYEPLLYAKYTKSILKEFILDINVESLLENERDDDKKALLLQKVNKAKQLYSVLKHAEPISKDLIPSTSLLWEFVGSAKDKIEPVGKIFSK
jgi:uridine kinase